MTDRVYSIMTRCGVLSKQIRQTDIQIESLNMSMLPNGISYDKLNVQSSPTDPMSGLKQEEYVNRFAYAETGIRHDYKGCQVINPVAVTLYKQDMSYEELMQIDLDLLAKCDAIYLMRGWSQSLGCNRELGYALGRDMMILREDRTRL